MRIFALLSGLALIGVGVAGYLSQAADARSMTALIPAFLGVLITVGGVIALSGRVKLGMHIAAAFGLLGVLGVSRNVPDFMKLFGDAESLARPLATKAQFVTFVICAVFTVACVASFVRARRSGGSAVSEA